MSRFNNIDNKKIEVCSELISDSNAKRENGTIIVFIGNYNNIFNSLNIKKITDNFEIMSIDSYNESNLINFNKNSILITNNYKYIFKLLNLNKKLLVLDISNREYFLIDYIINNSKKYEKFNIKNSDTYIAYTIKNQVYTNFSNIIEGKII